MLPGIRDQNEAQNHRESSSLPSENEGHTDRFWSRFPSWEAASEAWEEGRAQAKLVQPLKELTHRPEMVAMTKETRKGFRWKALKYLVLHDEEHKLVRYLLKSPIRHGLGYLASLWRVVWRGSSYRRDKDFFWYGLSEESQLIERYKQEPRVPFLLGFSYCHKPFECPDGRFTDRCRADLQSSVCRQCFIGKMVHAAPSRAQLLFIPTVHYIAQKVFEAIEKAPSRRVLFMITACEMTLEMFGDWGSAVGIEGVGIRLGGRICNTMGAFELSERGIKPGLTLVDEPTQERMLELLRLLRLQEKV